MNYIYAKWKWKKQCFEIIAQKISAKNMNNDLVFFRDEIKIFLISWFETRSRFVSSTSRASRRDREFVPSNLEFRDGDEILKKISRGRARYLVAKSHEIFRDRDISPCSAWTPLKVTEVTSVRSTKFYLDGLKHVSNPYFPNKTGPLILAWQCCF